jgi:hypothetical protein
MGLRPPASWWRKALVVPFPSVSDLPLTEAARDRIRERIGQVKADQKARGRYLGGTEAAPVISDRAKIER